MCQCKWIWKICGNSRKSFNSGADKDCGIGEATHGNKEFQQLKLDVFKIMVEDYGVRAFALEGDYGGCEAVNHYIHGDDGTVKDAVSAIGFAIYRTQEMENLISWMWEYN